MTAHFLRGNDATFLPKPEGGFGYAQFFTYLTRREVGLAIDGVRTCLGQFLAPCRKGHVNDILCEFGKVGGSDLQFEVATANFHKC